MPSNPKNTRMCCACRERSDKSEMLRIVRTPSGQIMLDDTKCADGRGVWVHDSAECKAKLKKRKLLNGAFKCGVAEAVYEQIEG